MERCPYDSCVENYKAFRSSVQGTVDKDQIFLSFSCCFFLGGAGRSHPWHVEVPRPGIKPTPQQQPRPLQWHCQILNSLCHKKTPETKYLFLTIDHKIYTVDVYLLSSSSFPPPPPLLFELKFNGSNEHLMQLGALASVPFHFSHWNR